MALPHPERAFDFAISIAVVHHLSTPQRRVQAVREILKTLKLPSASQGTRTIKSTEGGRALIYVWALEQKGSRRGWDEGDEQDVMVPWVTKVKKTGDDNTNGAKKTRNKEAESTIDRVSTCGLGDKSVEVRNEPTEKVYNRYYHLYRKGELEQDIQEAGGVVLQSGYEKDNWWAIAAQTSHRHQVGQGERSQSR